MNKEQEQALMEWEMVCSTAPTEEYTEEAEKKAAMLLGKLILLMKKRDDKDIELEKDIEYDDDEYHPNVIRAVNLFTKHKEFWVSTLAKRYQTLINKGKI